MATSTQQPLLIPGLDDGAASATSNMYGIVDDSRAADDRILLITGDSPTRRLATPTAIGRSFEPFVTGTVSLHTHDLVHVRLSDFPG